MTTITGENEPLDAATVVPYLRERGVFDADSEISARVLGGGVSNIVLLAEDGARRVVVKQALARLRVAEEWLAPPARVLTEARAIQFLGSLTPDAVPALLDRDPDRYAITVKAAPEGWRTWKEQLLVGDARLSVATELGSLVAGWHALSADSDSLAEYDDEGTFALLRIDPYHRTVQRRHPQLADAIEALLEARSQRRHCLVHGDLSPKNVLVGTRGQWVIDFEVSHLGDPAFDLAFLLSHLALKAVHIPRSADALRGCAEAFLTAYTDRWPAGGASDRRHLWLHVACLLLARVDGKSRAEYLSEPDRGTVRAAAVAMLRAPPATVAGCWARLGAGR